MNLNSKYKIGRRAVKTALSVSICILVSFLFKRENAFFASIAAIMCMQQTSDQTLKSGLDRFIGTVFGGILGYGVLEIICLFPNYNNILDAIVAPIFILILIYLFNFANKKESIGIGCIVLISIIAQPDKNLEDTLLYVIDRVIDTSIGIVIAMFINTFFLPNRKNSNSQ